MSAEDYREKLRRDEFFRIRLLVKKGRLTLYEGESLQNQFDMLAKLSEIKIQLRALDHIIKYGIRP